MTEKEAGKRKLNSFRIRKTQAQGHSQEVLRVLAQGHVHDAQRVVGVLLCRQQEGEQVQGVDVIALKLKSLADVPQSLRYLVKNKTNKNF